MSAIPPRSVSSQVFLFRPKSAVVSDTTDGSGQYFTPSSWFCSQPFLLITNISDDLKQTQRPWKATKWVPYEEDKMWNKTW